MLQRTMDFYNSIESSDGEELELELKILIDPRTKSPSFAKAHKDSNIRDIAKSILYECKDHGIASITQTMNFIHTENTQMFVKQFIFCKWCTR